MMIGLEAAVMCLALNIYHEARGEPFRGQVAVAEVTLRRAEFNPKQVCVEVFRPYQFSWTTKLSHKVKKGWRLVRAGMPRDRRAWDRAITIAKTAMILAHHWKPVVPGAKFYHSGTHKPSWARKMKLVAIIGNHRFYKETSVTAEYNQRHDDERGA